MYDRAEVLLREAFDTYVVEGWKDLGEDVLLLLTECEKYLQKDKQYLEQNNISLPFFRLNRNVTYQYYNMFAKFFINRDIYEKIFSEVVLVYPENVTGH